MATPTEDWAVFFQKTPKPAKYKEILDGLEEFLSTKDNEGLKIVLVSVCCFILVIVINMCER